MLLVTTTAISFINAFLPHIIKLLLSCVFTNSAKENDLQKEINDIKNEMEELSVIDEFAKHARLQRTANKLQRDLKSQVTSHAATILKYKFAITYIAQILLGLIFIVVIWMNKDSPVVTLKKEWLHPFDRWISWPTGIDGAVSISFWLLVTRTVARQMVSLFPQ